MTDLSYANTPEGLLGLSGVSVYICSQCVGGLQPGVLRKPGSLNADACRKIQTGRIGFGPVLIKPLQP